MYCEIKTERLLLRPLSVRDLKTVHEYASDIENCRYMMWLPNATIAETAAFLSSAAKEWGKPEPEFYEFAVVLGELQIGAVSLCLDEKREVAEIGWILNKRYQKRGYAAEAALAVKDFARRTLHVKKLVAHCDYRNEPSYRLMEKIGLKRESVVGTRFYPKRNETAAELTYSYEFE